MPQPPEECDDGNQVNSDGCWSNCREDDGFELYGLPLGGEVSFEVEGTPLSVETQDGASVASLMLAIVSAIQSDPQLQALGVDALRIGNRLATNGQVANVQIADPGLTLTLPRFVPALGPGGLLALAAGIGLAAGIVGRRHSA